MIMMMLRMRKKEPVFDLVRRECMLRMIFAGRKQLLIGGERQGEWRDGQQYHQKHPM